MFLLVCYYICLKVITIGKHTESCEKGFQDSVQSSEKPHDSVDVTF